MARTGRVWRVLVPACALGAGVLFATSAETARGTDLRGGRLTQLTELVQSERRNVADQERVAAALREKVASAGAAAAVGSSVVAAEQARAARVATAAGATSVTGPALTVVLDDAPTAATPGSTNPDDLVVHQQDVQSVVNALWAGGAEAMTIMGDRVVSTTAVRCVGNTLLVQGRLVGPPFRVSAIGDRQRMTSALAVEPGVVLFERYVARFGLRYDVVPEEDLAMPAYTGPLDLPHATATAP